MRPLPGEKRLVDGSEYVVYGWVLLGTCMPRYFCTVKLLCKISRSILCPPDRFMLARPATVVISLPSVIAVQYSALRAQPGA